MLKIMIWLENYYIYAAVKVQASPVIDRFKKETPLRIAAF
jgi:hypothetical protein